MKKLTTHSHKACGWSLIELVGVLAVIAILTAAIVPPLLRQLAETFRSNEARFLQQMADALKRSIIRQHFIPDHNGIAEAIAQELGITVNKVRFVRDGPERVFWIDPDLAVGPNGGGLPYLQTWQGSIQPVSPRILIISSLSRPLPENVVSGVAPSASAFASVWDAAENQVPADWTWSGDGADLKIQRLDMTPLFVRVSLHNSSLSPARFKVGDESTLRSIETDLFTHYLAGTRLGLYGSDDTLQTTEIIYEDSVYTFFYNGVWKRGLYPNPNLNAWRRSGYELQMACDLFMNSPPNPNAKHGVTQTNVVQAMIDYMNNYVIWAEAGFPNGMKQTLRKNAQDLDQVMRDYLFKAGKDL